MKTPSLSVVMPVHNALPFLDQSIGSIVNQTFTDFEFVILDDGSTDGSEKVLRAWENRDDRIRVFQSGNKLGLAGSSNLVVSKALGRVIARMDGDDISHPERLRRQWEIIEDRPDVVAVGTLCEGIDASGRRVRPRDRWRLVRQSRYIPFPHGSAMFRREAFDAVGGYGDRFVAGEDQDFFFKMTSSGRVVTLPDVLYQFRYHSGNTTLVTGAQAVHSFQERYSRNGENLAALYMLGAMRLWAGQPPRILPEMIAKKSLSWNLQSLAALASASLGSISPGTLRFFLRSLIRVRDGLAAPRVKDGRPYEWRLK
ncbi:MAG: glycosyltransferase family A protein [Pyrinomonadaceae bacterium]